MSRYFKRVGTGIAGAGGVERTTEVFDFWALTRDLLIVGVALIAVGMWGCPQYAVYSKRLEGASQLAQAQQNRQIAIQEAQAKMESAKLLALAEIERAKGVAGANKIIADGLKGNEEYLRYLWITDVAAVGKDGKTVVYVPTEANMPILEAGKR